MKKQATLSRAIWMICLLVGAALACNAPLADRQATVTTAPPTETPTETPSSPPVSTTTVPLVPATIPSAVETEEAEETSQPTLTPGQPPTLAATVSPSLTPRPTATVIRITPAATGRPSATPTLSTPASSGPLEFSYHFAWRFKDAIAMQAIATVTITARGGGGDYQYFRDELPVDGPIFEYEWATCSGNPGSLRVTSADGQSVKIDYFERPPCPTPTPTP